MAGVNCRPSLSLMARIGMFGEMGDVFTDPSEEFRIL